MKFFYVSDLHLLRGSDSRTELFVQFLNEVPKPGDSLVLGGDIFDMFIGNKRPFVEDFKVVLTALSELSSRGVKVYYLEGNHDFHLEKALPLNENFIVDDKRFFIEYQDHKILIEHGDLLNPNDYGYRLLRFVTRTKLFKCLLYLVPGFAVRMIGDWSSRKSRKYTTNAFGGDERSSQTRTMFKNFAEEKINEGMHLVLLGHSHLADFIEMEGNNGHKGTYINLGYSSSSIPYLEVSGASDNKLNLNRFDFTS